MLKLLNQFLQHYVSSGAGSGHTNSYSGFGNTYFYSIKLILGNV